MAEVIQDVNVDDASLWDFQFLVLGTTWTFDNSSLLWPEQRIGDLMMAKNAITLDGIPYVAQINITDYAQNGAVNPVLNIAVGYYNDWVVADLNNKPSTFSITLRQIADNTNRESDSLLDGIDYQSVWFEAASSAVDAGAPTFRIQRFSVYPRPMHSRTLNALNQRRIEVAQGENAAITYTVNWGALLNGDDISTSTWTTEDTGMTIANAQNDTTLATARLSATAPGKYRAVNKVVTASGDTYERYIDVVVNDNSSDQTPSDPWG